MSALLYENRLLISDTATGALSAITYRLPIVKLDDSVLEPYLHLPSFDFSFISSVQLMQTRPCTTQAPTFECQTVYINTTSYLTQGESITMILRLHYTRINFMKLS